RDDAQRLRLAAREERRAVRAWRHSDLDRDVADLVSGATVGALLLPRDALADDRLLELVERHLCRRAALEMVLALGVPAILREHLGFDGRRRVLALELVRD